jgi:hypothetical protein
MIQKILKPLNRFPLGIYRTIIILWVLVPIIIAFINSGNDEKEFWYLFFVFFVITYFLLLSISWIFEGFQQSQKK